MKFEELYEKLLKSYTSYNMTEELDRIKGSDYSDHQLDCLLHPENQPLVWVKERCSCTDENCECVNACDFDAIKKEKDTVIISKENCIGCSACIDSCKSKNLVASRDVIAALQLVFHYNGPVYAIVAPAFTGQFSDDITPGKLRSAFKLLGFAGMIEVATFADILTLKEALEFDRNIIDKSDYQLTSCCCPVWISMIKKIYSELLPHVPPSVSPMIACGRSVKKIYPDAKVVFVGPCLAKKAEAKEEDIKDAVDCVLTFKEVEDIFNAMDINPAILEDEERNHSSKAGRIYARTGGVSQAVHDTLTRLSPNKQYTIKSKTANGVKECQAMIKDILAGHITANFYEGMGCVGGCVGGPKIIIDREKGTENVNRYGEKAKYVTPIDNPYVILLLNKLGIDNVTDLLENSDIFSRKFKSGTV